MNYLKGRVLIWLVPPAGHNVYHSVGLSESLDNRSYERTQAFVEALAYPGKDCQSNEVTKTGGNGCGYIVWIDACLLGTHNYTNHDDTCK